MAQIHRSIADNIIIIWPNIRTCWRRGQSAVWKLRLDVSDIASDGELVSGEM